MARAAILNGFLQSDLDAKGFRILNLNGTSITSLGVITSGTWQGSPIASAYLVGTDITSLGVITVGTWRGSVIGAGYLPSIDQLSPPGGPLNANNQRIINVATPTTGSDAATKSYADGLASGLQVKSAVAVGTTGNITLSGLQTIDGYTTLAGDRVLVKNQTTQTANGCYDAGTGAWARSADSSTGALLLNASYAVVNGGQAGGVYYCNTPGPITIGTSNITFVLQSPPVKIDNILPSQSGMAGQYLSSDGTHSKWALVPLNAINVKGAPYNAKGDGVSDDTSAIQSAINGAGGVAVYFPAGTYLCGGLTTPAGSPTCLWGSGPTTSVLRAKPNTIDMITLNASGSALLNMWLRGPLLNSVQPLNVDSAVTVTTGSRLDNLVIMNCVFTEHPWVALNVAYARNVKIMGCEFSCGAESISAGNAHNILISGNFFHDLGQSAGIISGDGIRIVNNHVARAGPVGGGFLINNGSSNIVVAGNVITDSAGGYEFQQEPASPTATADFGQDCVIANNVCSRIHNSAIGLARGGCIVTGNAFKDCSMTVGQANSYTCVPGIVPDLANPGTGYAVGDILTLSGGTGTAASFVVNGVQAGGALCTTSAPGQNSLTYPITLGNYTTYPTNSVSVTGGHGTAAKVIYTNLQIAAAGTGYVAGDMLQSNNGTFRFAVMVKVVSVGGSGNVTAVEVISGGVFTGTLPTTLTFVTLSMPTNGSGFTATPCWGKRYSQTYYAGAGGNIVDGAYINTQGNLYVICSSNHFTQSATSVGTYTDPVGILFEDYNAVQTSHWVIQANLFSPFAATGGTASAGIKHLASGAPTYDDSLGGGNVIGNNLGYP